MTQTFTCFRDLGVPVVDADAHVNEPPDLWQDRVAAKWRDRAPKVIDCDGGDCWSFENGDWLRPLGLNATAGLGVAQFRCEGVRYSDMRPGAFDPKATRRPRRRRHPRAGAVPVDRLGRRSCVREGA